MKAYKSLGSYKLSEFSPSYDQFLMCLILKWPVSGTSSESDNEDGLKEISSAFDMAAAHDELNGYLNRGFVIKLSTIFQICLPTWNQQNSRVVLLNYLEGGVR